MVRKKIINEYKIYSVAVDNSILIPNNMCVELESYKGVSIAITNTSGNNIFATKKNWG